MLKVRLSASVFGAVVLSSTPLSAQSQTAGAQATFPPQLQPGQPTFPPRLQPVPAPQPYAYIAADIAQWNGLRSNTSAPFEIYARFILAHRNWPGETDLRRKAERQIVVGVTGQTDVVRFFSVLPPLTAQGQATYALALLASGQSGRATDAARAAWTQGSLSPEVESRLLAAFPNQIRPADHDRRADVLLDLGDAAGAQRAMVRGTGQRQSLHLARIAVQARSADASTLVSSLDDRLRGDVGLACDQATAASRGSPALARQILAQRARSDRPSGNPERLMTLMVALARGAVNDGQSRLAYDIASKVDDIYPSGTDISDRPFDERDEYTNLTWLAGRTAIAAGRPAEAVGMFERYARGGASPNVRAKGYYWAGHAAGLAGDQVRSRDLLSRAARNTDQYYGQLAADRLGRSLEVPPPDAPVSVADRAAFERKPLVAAIRYAGSSSNRVQQSLFIRALAEDVDTPAERLLASELGRQIGRRDVGVWVARAARSDGDDEVRRWGYPQLTVPPAQVRLTAIIHGITRTESQYDQFAQSPVGARGLMQLMPGTAAGVSRQMGVGYALGRLTADPDYNVSLGSHYFESLLSDWGGSYPLAVASYNAGPGNVRRWIAANGDPRNGGIDWVEWVEKIPITETRNYVQRVLEAAVVYDLLYGNRGAPLPAGRLSQYIGIRR